MSRQFPTGRPTDLTPAARALLVGLDRHLDRQDSILAKILTTITNTQEAIMAGIQDITDQVTAQRTVIDSAVTLLEELHTELSQAVASNDPAAVQAVLDQLQANTQSLASAVETNTPAAPTGGAPTGEPAPPTA